MKRKIISVLFAALLTAGVLGGCAGGQDKSAASDTASSDAVTEVNVGTMGTYSPYSYQDEKGNLTGYDLEVLRKVEETDPSLHFNFIAGPWDSLFVGLDSDKFQAIANQITSTDERQAKYYLTTESYYNSVYQIIVKEGRKDINTLNDLKGKKIGMTAGDSFTKYVEDWNKANGNILTITYYDEDITTILQDIANGRIDATVNDPAVAVAKGKAEGLAVEPAGERLQSEPTYFIFKKDAEGKQLQEKTDAALKKLKEDGELSKLSVSWFGADYTK